MGKERGLIYLTLEGKLGELAKLPNNHFGQMLKLLSDRSTKVYPICRVIP
jgi:hypothetical protein